MDSPGNDAIACLISNPPDRQILAGMLRQEGYTAIAPSPAEAPIENWQDVSMVIADEAAARGYRDRLADLKKSQPELFIPVLVCVPPGAEEQELLDGGADELVRLPLTRVGIGVRVRNLLRIRRQTLDLKQSKDALQEANERLEERVQERTRALQQALDRIAFQHQLLDVVQQAVIVTSLQGQVLYWNPYAEQLYGWTEKEAIGASARRLIVPIEEYGRVEEIMDLLRRGKSWSGEFYLNRKDGTDLWVHVTNSPVYDTDGRLIAVVGISSDVTEQHNAQEAVAARERRFRNLIEQSYEGIGLLNPDGTATFLGQTAQRILRYEPEELAGRNVMELFHPEDRERCEALLHEVMREPLRSVSAEYRFLCGNGEWRWMEGSAVNLLHDPDVGAIVINFRDIQERKEAEQSLLKAHSELQGTLERMRAIVQCSPLAIITRDEYGKITGWNAAARDIFGWEESEVLGTDTPIGPRMPMGRRMRQVVKGQVIRSRRVQRERRDGTRIWVSLSASPLHDSDGRTIGVMSMSADITAQVEMEQALAEREQQFRKLFENAPMGIALANLEHQVVHPNTAFCEMLGYSSEEATGLSISDITHPEDLLQTRAMADRLAAGEVSSYRVEKRYLTKSGELRWGEAAISRLDDGHGNPRGAIVIIMDITARKQAEEQLAALAADRERQVQVRTAELQAANKDLESFSYSVSHDLRAPLRAILGFAGALEEDHAEELSGQAKAYVHRILDAGDRMGDLINGLLGLSRMARSEIRPVRVDLSTLAGAVAAELSMQDEDRRVDWQITANLAAEGDPTLLRVVLQNLLGNAWKYTRKSEIARIQFTRVERDGRTVFVVRDNGVGFNMQYADRLFGVFQRLHSSNEFEGTGIGLATVQRIIHRHGGEIWADSSPGEGAAFYFTLGDHA